MKTFGSVLAMCCVLSATACRSAQPVRSEIRVRIAEARVAAQESAALVHGKEGETPADFYRGVDKYLDLLNDKNLNATERRLVVESAETNLSLLGTYRCEVEQQLAYLYSGEETRNDEKAARYAGLVLSRAGSILDSVHRAMVTIRVAALCRLRKYHEAEECIRSARRSAPEWHDILDRWERQIKDLTGHQGRPAGVE